jgi:hypothetical protein
MRVRLAIALALAAVSIAIPAFAADAPQPAARTAAPKRVTANMHYPTLEKMLRRFSRQAGESRTRG